MKKTLEITIGPDGQFSLEVHGFRGATCHNASKAFEEALGEVQDRRHTVDYFQPEATKNQQRIGQ